MKLVCGLLLCMVGCGSAPENVVSPQRPIFVDVGLQAGVTIRTVSGTPEKEHIVECNTSGAALFDYDSDGDLDIFIVNGSRIGGYEQGQEPRAALYRNDGDWDFSEVGASAGVNHAGWGMGVSVVDYNADGNPDLYLANYGLHQLL
mgnify:FL=1